MNKKEILDYLQLSLNETSDYELKPCFNSFQPGQLTWIKIERVR